MPSKKNISQLYRIIIIVIACLPILVLGSISIHRQYSDFLKESKEVKKEYVAAQERIVRLEVQNALAYIQWRRETANVSESDLQKEVLEWLSMERFSNRGREDGILFARSFQGKLLMSVSTPEMVGKNISAMKAPDGIITHDLFMRAIRNPNGGYAQYSWYNPVEKKVGRKKSFIAAVPDWQWYIGAGFWYDDINTVIAQKRSALKGKVQDYAAVMILSMFFLFVVVFLISRSLSEKMEKSFEGVSEFFKKAVTQTVKIDPKDMHFAEFEELAYTANQMVAKRKQAEDALATWQVELSLFRALIDHSYDAILIISPEDGHFLDANARACEMLGYTRKELLGMDVTGIDAMAALPEEFSWERHVEELRHMPNLVLESVHKRKDGTTFPVEINVRVISLDDGEYMISVARDITERKASEKELQKYRENLERLVEERTETLTRKTADLEQTQKALQYLLEDLNLKTDELAQANVKFRELDQLKSMFIASMSHELRTPLNSIIGFTGVMLQGMSGEINNEQRDQLQRVYGSGKHLLALITDVIDISKIEAKKTETYVSEFNLAEVIQEAAITVQPEIEKKDLMLEVTMPAAIPLKTDRRRLFQCILNLLSNAVKYTEKGTICIETHVHDELLDISVTDTGIGISEQDLPVLFQSFVRLESHLKIKAGGTGLGLYLIRKIASDLLGGTVSAQSTLGEGSTFVLTIPQRVDDSGLRGKE
ncbi:MAG: ATP-binding protein [Desulfobacteraceae bacterium]|jgi:PAS domain S-box-containing protein|nr:ATP-binding protein [Desulfobacteraceae bacterium]